MKNLVNVGLIELSIQEERQINGGDKFMQDLGNSVGRIFGSIFNAIDYVNYLPSNIATEIGIYKIKLDSQIEAFLYH